MALFLSLSDPECFRANADDDARRAWWLRGGGAGVEPGADGLSSIERRLASDDRIGILVNNAGAALPGSFAEQQASQIDWLVRLNITAATRLISAITPRRLKAGEGAIINLASVVGLAPEIGLTVYGATKAYLLFLSQGLQLELGPRGIYIQAVLPAATRTEIWGRSGRDVNTLKGVMGSTSWSTRRWSGSIGASR